MIITAQSNNFRVRLTVEDATSKELIILRKSAQHLAQALGSSQFRSFCENFRYIEKWYTGKWWWKKWHSIGRGSFHYTEETNAQVFEKLSNGKEVLSPDPDMEADINLHIDRRNIRGVVGYTYPNTKWQWVYAWVLRDWSEVEVAANLGHEWAHKCGYGHEYRYTVNREFSVPYAVGKFIANFKPNTMEMLKDNKEKEEKKLTPEQALLFGIALGVILSTVFSQLMKLL